LSKISERKLLHFVSQNFKSTYIYLDSYSYKVNRTRTMSGKFRDKNLLFLCKQHPESMEFLNELSKNELLERQFILIDQNDPKINLPPKIASINQPLILIPNGAQEPIINKDAVFWIKNNAFSEKANGLEFMDIGGGGGLAPTFLDELDKKGVKLAGTSRYGLIGGENDKIETYEQGGSGRGPKKSDMDVRLDKLRTERNDLDARGRPPPGATMNFSR